MDDLLLTLAREGRVSPQSPDEDLASRLIMWSQETFRSAQPLARAHPRSAVLLSYLSVFHLVRALISAKGYRLTGNNPHVTVQRLAAHFLGNSFPLDFFGEIARRWDVTIENPDMPDVDVPAPRALKETQALLTALRRIFEKSLPEFRPLFRSSSRRTVSPERSFR